MTWFEQDILYLVIPIAQMVLLLRDIKYFLTKYVILSIVILKYTSYVNWLPCLLTYNVN